MKTILSFSSLLLCALLFANDSAINFSEDSYAEVLSQAKAQNKPVFIDFYAVWCGPCKYMEKEVFSDPAVGEFMNANFISLRVDAENEELDLVTKHRIQAYPTLAYLNKHGRLVFKHEGAVDKETFLRQASDLINQGTYSETYAKKSKNVEAVRDYARSLKMTNPAKANKIVLVYLKEVDEKKWSQEENWQLIREFVLGTNLISFKKVLANLEIRELYPEELRVFADRGYHEIIARSMEKGDSYTLRQANNIATKHHQYFDNVDSLILDNQIAFAEKHAPEQLPGLLETYIERRSDQRQQVLLYASNLLVKHHFNREILSQAMEWAKESLRLQESAAANVMLALAHEKLNEFREANAYLVLALKEANPEALLLIEEHLNRVSEKMEYESEDAEGVTVSSKVKMRDDGRFTLGAGSKRLMYGFPIPTSTSHFVVKINGKLATNSPSLALKGPVHLTGRHEYEGNAMTPSISISFQFQKVRIIQTLEPVDRRFRPISEGYAQFYKVSYRFENLEPSSKRIGLGILFDTMIDDNDYCAIAADGKIVETEYGFAGRGVPRELLFYRTKGDTSDMMGAAVLHGGGATKPDRMVVGRWPVLHETTWELRPKKVKYGDSAYFLQWENRSLSARAPLQFVTYYGLPYHKTPELRIIVEDHNLLTRKESIYFELGDDRVDLNAKMRISEILDNEDVTITGVLLNGYADIVGDEKFNFDLSKRRIENVGKLFLAYGIPYVPKPYGTELSERSSLNATYGNVWDRRVEVIVYYKPKEENLLTVD